MKVFSGLFLVSLTFLGFAARAEIASPFADFEIKATWLRYNKPTSNRENPRVRVRLSACGTSEFNMQCKNLYEFASAQKSGNLGISQSFSAVQIYKAAKEFNPDLENTRLILSLWQAETGPRHDGYVYLDSKALDILDLRVVGNSPENLVILEHKISGTSAAVQLSISLKDLDTRFERYNPPMAAMRTSNAGKILGVDPQSLKLSDYMKVGNLYYATSANVFWSALKATASVDANSNALSGLRREGSPILNLEKSDTLALYVQNFRRAAVEAKPLADQLLREAQADLEKKQREGEEAKRRAALEQSRALQDEANRQIAKTEEARRQQIRAKQVADGVNAGIVIGGALADGINSILR